MKLPIETLEKSLLLQDGRRERPDGQIQPHRLFWSALRDAYGKITFTQKLARYEEERHQARKSCQKPKDDPHDYELEPHQAEMLDLFDDSKSGYVPQSEVENSGGWLHLPRDRHHMAGNPEGYPMISEAAKLLNVLSFELLRLRDRGELPRRFYYQPYLGACRFDVKALLPWWRERQAAAMNIQNETRGKSDD